jgi:cytochrome oxidase Cu insertion factor (SCO1/SenC/PrrC family)
MDPEVKSKKPGSCPKCGMTLMAASDEAPKKTDDNAATDKDDRAALGSIPDVSVYDQDGRKLRFYTDLVKGKTVAINFIFTTCTTICPPLAATFRRVQVELGDRSEREVRLISISVDPVTDVPQRLKAFSAKFKAGPGWTFVTGSKPDIDVLLKALGAAVADKNDHTPMVLVGNDAAGYWTRTYGLAPTATLVRVITEAASKSSAPRN